MSEEVKPDRTVDLRQVACPGSYVQALAVMQEESEGRVVEFLLKAGTALMDVPRYMRAAGHEVVQVREIDENYVSIVVRRGADRFD